MPSQAAFAMRTTASPQPWTEPKRNQWAWVRPRSTWEVGGRIAPAQASRFSASRQPSGALGSGAPARFQAEGGRSSQSPPRGGGWATPGAAAARATTRNAAAPARRRLTLGALSSYPSNLPASELERGAVHAVAQPRGLRAIVEDVAQVAAAAPAVHLGARREEAAVRRGAHRVVERRVER